MYRIGFLILWGSVRVFLLTKSVHASVGSHRPTAIVRSPWLYFMFNLTEKWSVYISINRPKLEYVPGIGNPAHRINNIETFPNHGKVGLVGSNLKVVMACTTRRNERDTQEERKQWTKRWLATVHRKLANNACEVQDLVPAFADCLLFPSHLFGELRWALLGQDSGSGTTSRFHSRGIRVIIYYSIAKSWKLDRIKCRVIVFRRSRMFFVCSFLSPVVSSTEGTQYFCFVVFSLPWTARTSAWYGIVSPVHLQSQ